jgi:hypothetical protein
MRSSRMFPLVVLAIMLGSPRDARAGRGRFGWLYGSELVPEKGVELESWLVNTNQKGDTNENEFDWWFGPVFSVTPHLELAIPLEAEYVDNHMDPALSQFVRFGGEIRYRPQSPDPVDAGPLTNMFRFGVKRMIDKPAGVRTELDIVATYQSGPFLATIDLGAIDEHVTNDADVVEFRPGGGASVRVVRDLRIGAELYGELTLTGDDVSWMVVGPTVSLTSGRIWGAASAGVGVLGVRDAGRITFGVAL